MMIGTIAFVLRMALIFTIWMFVWTLIKPRTQTLRITRAALLVFILLIVLAALRAAGM